MAFSVSNKSFDNSPRVISIEVGEKFYKELQRQMETALSSMTPDQILALVLVLLGLSLLSEALPETALKAEQDESNFVWSYLSQLHKNLPEGKTLNELLREANIQLVVNAKPIEMHNPSKSPDNDLGDPFENFKRGWDDVMHGRTM